MPDRSGTMALRRVTYAAIPSIESRELIRILGRPVAVPNWVLAVTVATTLGITATLSQGLALSPAVTTNQTAQPIAALVAQSVSNSGQVGWSSNAVIKQGPDTASTRQVAALKGEIQSMNGDLQGLQRQNDALRNLTHQQSAGLTTAESNLAASQDVLDGESQDLGARLTTMQHEVDGRVPGLESGLKAAGDLVNQIRKLLGMPAVTLPVIDSLYREILAAGDTHTPVAGLITPFPGPTSSTLIVPEGS